MTTRTDTKQVNTKTIAIVLEYCGLSKLFRHNFSLLSFATTIINLSL